LFVELEKPLLYEQYPSQIRMYPVDYFEFIHPQDYERIQNYWLRLQNEPDNVEQAMFLLQFGAGVLHSSHYARVEFEGGYGIRYIVQFAQNIAPLSGADMVYTFQGVSDDGKYYISALLPITIPSTLAYNEEIGDFYDHSYDEQLQINDDLRTLITETQGHEFFPTIDSLDGVIQSIRLDGFGQMPPVVAFEDRYRLEDVQFDASTINDELGGYFEGQDQGTSWLHFRLVESLWSPITVDNHLFVINVKPIERILQYEDGIFAIQVWRVQQALRDKPEIPETVERNLYLSSYDRLDNVRYIQTEHLDGVRFLYQSGSGPVRYIFSGISTDGRYLIEASLPVTETEDGTTTPCIEGLDVMFETMTFDGSVIVSDFECGASD
jgi:hypothetical protein